MAKKIRKERANAVQRISMGNLLRAFVAHWEKQHDGCINGCHGILILPGFCVFTEQCRDHYFRERYPEHCHR
ncbi:MAG: hypothetical protein HUU08_00890 [Candidatus Brocadia sp.]|nr:hypothetical protein [Candidatus Brocadia sp.]